MSDKDDTQDITDGETGGEETQPEKKRLVKKRLLIYGTVLLLLLGGGAGSALYFGLVDLGLGGGEDANEEQAARKPALFYDLPDITVNLATLDQRAQYLRLKVALEVSDRDTANVVVPMMPRVLDAFQVYLRELRTTDLEGSAGIYRLKEELRRRVNLAVHPAKVNDILFKEILIQ